jgi:hypothetical protein
MVQAVNDCCRKLQGVDYDVEMIRQEMQTQKISKAASSNEIFNMLLHELDIEPTSKRLVDGGTVRSRMPVRRFCQDV